MFLRDWSGRPDRLAVAALALAVAWGWAWRFRATHGTIRQIARSPFADAGGTRPELVVATVSAARRPVVLTDSPIGKWEALRAWTPAWLSTAVHAFPAVAELEQPTFVHSEAGRTMGVQLGMGLPPADRYRVVRNMTVERFFTGHRQEAPRQYWKLVAKLDGEPFSTIEGQATPRAFLSTPNSKFRPDVSIWAAGAQGTAMASHYDIADTWVAQVLGTKRWTLFPPSRWPAMRPYPHGHPAWRQASLSVERREAAEPPLLSSCSPGSGEARCAERLQTDLSPGELLYVVG